MKTRKKSSFETSGKNHIGFPKKMENINFELILGPGVQYHLLEGALNGPLAEYD